jgi:protein-S-isoprenylcysteine O-methyltransferase Ste14
MATPFQPEDPHPKTSGTTPISRGTIFTVALLSALSVIMIIAIVIPRAAGSHEATNWVVTLGAGALAAGVVVAMGLARRAGADAETHRATDGAGHEAVEQAKG